jgi:hypothetical protein
MTGMRQTSNGMPPQLWCMYEGRLSDIKNFFVNLSYIHDNNYNRMYYCKSCSKEIANQIFARHNNFQYACIEMCSVFDLPYIPEAAISLQEYETNTTTVNKNYNRVGQYIDILTRSKKDGGLELTPDNPVWNDLATHNYIKNNLLKSIPGNNDGDEDLFAQLEEEWGRQDKLQDYLWLEERFHTYSDSETLTPAMSNTLKYLCLAELDVIKLRDNKADQKEITAVEKRVSDYYDKLKLSDFKFNKAKSDAEKLIETWAYIEENYEPLDWDSGTINDSKIDTDIVSLNPLKDRLGIDDDYDNIVRSFGNRVCGSKDYPALEFGDVKKKNDRETNN